MVKIIALYLSFLLLYCLLQVLDLNGLLVLLFTRLCKLRLQVVDLGHLKAR